MAEPQIRAALTKLMLAGIFREIEASQALVLRDVPEDDVRLVEDSFGLTWLPARIHVEIADAILRHVGRTKYVAFWCNVCDQILTMSLFKAVAESAMKLHDGPLGLLRATPHAWPTVARNLGGFETTGDAHEQRATVTFRGFAPELSKTGTFAYAFAGAFEGFIAQTGCKGRVEVHDLDVKAGAARYEVTWNIRPPA